MCLNIASYALPVIYSKPVKSGLEFAKPLQLRLSQPRRLVYHVLAVVRCARKRAKALIIEPLLNYQNEIGRNATAIKLPLTTVDLIYYNIFIK